MTMKQDNNAERCRSRLDRMIAMEHAIYGSDSQGDGLWNDTLSEVSHCLTSWREKVVMWAYEVIDHLNESRSVVYVAMNILDRYASLQDQAWLLKEQNYELASLSALFIAIRIAGTGNLNLSRLISMSRGGIETKDIIEMGTKIVKDLQWDYRLVTPSDFANAFMGLLPSNISKSQAQDILDTSSYLLDISVCDVFLSSRRPSQVALAAVLNALDELPASDKEGFSAFLNDISDAVPNAEGITEIRSRLQQIYDQSSECDHSSSTSDAPTGGDNIILPQGQGLRRAVSDDDLVNMHKRQPQVQGATSTQNKRRRIEQATLIEPNL